MVFFKSIMEKYVAKWTAIVEAYDTIGATIFTSSKSKTKTINMGCDGITSAKTTVEISRVKQLMHFI